MFYTKDGWYPTELPERIRLSNGLTKTDSSTFTEEDIEDAGYIAVEDKPEIESYQEVEWDSENFEWKIISIEESVLSSKMKELRNSLINKESWRFDRYKSETRLGLEPSEDISKLDKYIQKLRDVPQQENFPFEIKWPSPIENIEQKIKEEEEIVLIRVYELATEFDTNSKNIIKMLKDAGEEVKSHLSSVDSKIARDIIHENI